MTRFYNEIYTVVTTGLSELRESQEAGKTPKNPVSETLYLSNWVTKAIKQQRFDTCVAKVLLSWQQQSRTMGKNAQLTTAFEHIASTYGKLTDAEGNSTNISNDTIHALYQDLSDTGWLVTTEYEVNRKVTHKTDGQASLVVCVKQYQQALSESGELIRPISLYVRGDVKQLVDTAYKHGLLLFKVTDYKSLVKYHGEYIVYPANNGPQLPELPTV
ncbi:DUF2913 family protein [Photobacterium damselae]|uniref:DUF2913 family protein n=1 Tax=Photobacterium damselae TaxID=38293 RepID=UPI0010FD8A02|nr:DUF2913 family protein [Photobacterium damselae]TLS71309.1 DUF2913 family protein [Photobacterium damselae subsp. damselae]